MDVGKRRDSGEARPRVFRGAPRTLFCEEEPEEPPKGPLFPRPVLRALLGLFFVSLMLTADWYGLLLLNAEGVHRQIGGLNTLKVTAALMGGIAIPSALLMLHYRRLYSYTSEENVFFATTFSISFMLGFPCLLASIFG